MTVSGQIPGSGNHGNLILLKTRPINREDMLELTRRMNVSRNCLTRAAGCYVDRSGELEDTFNVNFRKLSARDQTVNLAIARTVPFGDTNQQTKEYMFPEGAFQGQTMWKLMSLMVGCGLKNDILMETFYEQIMRSYKAAHAYAVDVYHGVYDVPLKGSDHAYEDESEEVYSFLICTIGNVDEDYHVSRPDFGFLFPAFRERSSDTDAVDVFCRAPGNESLIRTVLSSKPIS